MGTRCEGSRAAFVENERELRVGGCVHDPPGDPDPRGGLVRPVEHVGVKVDVPGLAPAEQVSRDRALASQRDRPGATASRLLRSSRVDDRFVRRGVV